MVGLEQLREKALEIARKHLGDGVKDAVAEEDVNAEGESSVRVTIIIRKAWTAPPSGDKLSRIGLDLVDYLSEQGDPRVPYTHYATASEYRRLTEHTAK